MVHLNFIWNVKQLRNLTFKKLSLYDNCNVRAVRPVLLASVVLATLCFGKIDEIELLLSKILEYDMLI